MVAVLMALGLASGPGTRDTALRAGALTKVDPGRVSVGVLVNLTGAGFATTAAANEVVFTPQNGSSVTVRANAVATVNEKRGTRRLTVLVPSLPDGPAAVRVVNTVSGEQSTTSTVRIISLSPSVTELQQGETRDLVVTGSAETAFVARTRVALGSGIKVESVVVESPTRLVARVTVATTATVGARTLDVSASGLLARYTGMAVVVRGPANVAPTVNAGADQSITLPAAASLAGSATDDGLPAGSTLTYAWAQVSGPGTATFAAPTSASTSATFSAAGAYVLRLTASDGALSGTDTVTVTVTDAPQTNLAPTVEAGADQSITLPAAASLAGSATDDGLPAGSTLTYAWAQVSGPGTATFTAPTNASTSATFSAAGTYVLRLTASDGALSGSDTVTVTVTDAPQTNLAPTANAGADQSITLPAAASLAGSATDDGLPAGSTLT
ncbi:PKD domain-containing protein, partial [Luteitalea sp.]